MIEIFCFAKSSWTTSERQNPDTETNRKKTCPLLDLVNAQNQPLSIEIRMFIFFIRTASVPKFRLRSRAFSMTGQSESGNLRLTSDFSLFLTWRKKFTHKIYNFRKSYKYNHLTLVTIRFCRDYSKNL